MRQLRRLLGRRRAAPANGRGNRRAGAEVPRCRAHFDVIHGGAAVDADAGPEVHLDPIPLLVRDGVLSMAVQPTPTAVM